MSEEEAEYLTDGINIFPKPTTKMANERMDKLKSELAKILGSQELALDVFMAIRYGRLTGVSYR